MDGNSCNRKIRCFFLGLKQFLSDYKYKLSFVFCCWDGLLRSLSIRLMQEILPLNSVLPFQTLGKFDYSVLSTVWITDSGRWHCTNTVCAAIATWLNDSQGRGSGVRLGRHVPEVNRIRSRPC